MAVKIVPPQTASPVRALPDLASLAPAPATPPGIEASAAPIRVGVIGFGYWGPNVVRNFSEVPGSQVWGVSDLREERLAEAHARYPAITTTADPRSLINDPAIDAVIIMTPISTHYRLALEALEAGKHVLVAKPLVTSSEQAIHLIEEAERRQRVLMVDHTFIYTGAVRRIKELVDSGSLGRLYYYDSVRVNLGLFQHDVNVLWDLAVHDLTIMDYVMPGSTRAVAATGAAHIQGHPVNMAYLTCFFDDTLLAHHHVNWLAPVKVRRTLIGGDRQMIVYDDLEPSEKVKVYDKGVTVSTTPGEGLEEAHDLLVSYRAGDVLAPQLGVSEALSSVAQHFAECVREGRRPLTDGTAGLRVIRLLEAAEQSLANGGTAVELR